MQLCQLPWGCLPVYSVYFNYFTFSKVVICSGSMSHIVTLESNSVFRVYVFCCTEKSDVCQEVKFWSRFTKAPSFTWLLCPLHVKRNLRWDLWPTCNNSTVLPLSHRLMMSCSAFQLRRMIMSWTNSFHFQMDRLKSAIWTVKNFGQYFITSMTEFN